MQDKEKSQKYFFEKLVYISPSDKTSHTLLFNLMEDGTTVRCFEVEDSSPNDEVFSELKILIFQEIENRLKTLEESDDKYQTLCLQKFALFESGSFDIYGLKAGFEILFGEMKEWIPRKYEEIREKKNQYFYNGLEVDEKKRLLFIINDEGIMHCDEVENVNDAKQSIITIQKFKSIIHEEVNRLGLEDDLKRNVVEMLYSSDNSIIIDDTVLCQIYGKKHVYGVESNKDEDSSSDSEDDELDVTSQFVDLLLNTYAGLIKIKIEDKEIDKKIRKIMDAKNPISELTEFHESLSIDQRQELINGVGYIREFVEAYNNDPSFMSPKIEDTERRNLSNGVIALAKFINDDKSLKKLFNALTEKWIQDMTTYRSKSPVDHDSLKESTVCSLSALKKDEQLRCNFLFLQIVASITLDIDLINQCEANSSNQLEGELLKIVVKGLNKDIKDELGRFILKVKSLSFAANDLKVSYLNKYEKVLPNNFVENTIKNILFVKNALEASVKQQTLPLKKRNIEEKSEKLESDDDSTLSKRKKTEQKSPSNIPCSLFRTSTEKRDNEGDNDINESLFEQEGQKHD